MLPHLAPEPARTGDTGINDQRIGRKPHTGRWGYQAPMRFGWAMLAGSSLPQSAFVHFSLDSPSGQAGYERINTSNPV